MDTAFSDNLDRYIFKLQQVSQQLNRRRSASFFRTKCDEPVLATKSARLFLAHCALVSALRPNIEAISDPSCVVLIAIPNKWDLSEIKEAAKTTILKDAQVKLCIHPTSKGRSGWNIEPNEFLSAGRLIVFVPDGSAVHPDFELAATIRLRIDLCKVRHLRALAHLRGCGDLSAAQADVIAKQPSERMEAIFRIGQPIQRAVDRLSAEDNKASSLPPKSLDISKGFGAAGRFALELKRDIREWRDGHLNWSEVDKGFLLWGPPGTGKTRFAAALAVECRMHLEATSVSKWQSTGDGCLGDMLKALYHAFAAAKENSPCILFVDEIDSIGDRAKFPARHANYSTQVVNALLEALDGIDSREGVIVIGACNRPQAIDPAILRSGRLERHIHFPLPDAVARTEILEFHLPSLAGEPALKEIGARLPGKSSADLEQIARDARRSARREGRAITLDDLRSKIEPIAPLNTDEQLRVAVHEAGHALIANSFKVGRVHRVEIFDNVNTFATEVDAHGLTTIEYPQVPWRTKWQMMKLITMHLAGAAAEQVFFKNFSTMSSGRDDSDFARATALAIEMVANHGFGESRYFLPHSVDLLNPADLWKDERLEGEVKEILDVQFERATQMLDGLSGCLAVMALELTQKKCLEGEALEMLWPGKAKTPPTAPS